MVCTLHEKAHLCLYGEYFTLWSLAMNVRYMDIRYKEAFCIWAKSMVAMLCLGFNAYVSAPHSAPFLIGSFGASAVLLFATPQSPLAQPRNVLGGHVLSALVGVTVVYVMGAVFNGLGGDFASLHLVLGASLAVSLAIALMFLTDTLHPPGGATALIAVIGGESIHSLGYWYVLTPTLSGACILVFMTWLLSKLTPSSPYPCKVR